MRNLLPPNHTPPKGQRLDLLDNPLAHRLGVGVSGTVGQGLAAKFRKLWYDTFLSDAWQDAEFMDDVRQATLRGAHPAAQLLFYVLLGFLVLFLLWAAFARLDEVTHAPGQVIPSGKVQLVGSPEGGVVKEILVQSGQVVEPGQVLVRLDDAQAASGVGEKVNRRDFLQANMARLQAEVEGTDLAFPASLISSTDPNTPLLLAEVTKLFDNRKSELEATRAVLNEQVEQRRQELNDARRTAGSLASALQLAQDELNMTKPVFESGAISKADLLRLERAVVDARKNYNTAQTAIPAAQAALREAQSKVEEATLKYKNEARDELGKLTEEFNRLGQGVQADVARVDRAVLKSPIRAEVKQVLVNTIGQAVQPNTNIVELVPLEETLLVEARVRPQDVAFLRPGLPVLVKITAYDFSIYGGLQGTVESISADSFTDENARSGNQPETYFKVNVRTKQNYLQRFGQKLPIKSGMVATADIVTGKKTVLQYLLKPLNKARERALTER
ncbi:MAG: HlyD family type I secretion periplasmic adaptor subunit [Alphaproteobacteria bacterium]|nr:HlyD family type I secretion periplasmic adaptor subunit [Alphaproteobacteria bacterium]